MEKLEFNGPFDIPNTNILKGKSHLKSIRFELEGEIRTENLESSNSKLIFPQTLEIESTMIPEHYTNNFFDYSKV